MPAATEKAGTAQRSRAATSAAAAEETEASQKDETVYVLTGTDGSVQKIIVSDWVKNTLGEGSLRDESGLDNIQNVKGNESYTPGGDNTKVWDAAGKDIYYQGNIDKQLPVALSVTYTLDGKTITAEELAGKSGKVTIRYTYTTTSTRPSTIDGRQEKIYVPFAMLTGLLLDNNVLLQRGRSQTASVVNDGSHIVVVGIALPGLQESLQIDADKLELPETSRSRRMSKNFDLGEHRDRRDERDVQRARHREASTPPDDLDGFPRRPDGRDESADRRLVRRFMTACARLL